MSRLNVNQIYTRTGTGSPAIREMPLFSVSLGSDQTGVAGSVDTKVLFDTVGYDIGSYWDTTNKRYLPTIPGFYQFNVVLRCQVGGGSSNLMRVRLDKNGTEQAASYLQSSTNIFNNSHVTLSHLIYCNGSDYVEALGYIATGTTTSRSFGTFAATVGGSTFSGFLVRPD